MENQNREDDESSQKGFIRRATKFSFVSSFTSAPVNGYRHIKDDLLSKVRFRKIDRRGYEGRYHDGGIEKFIQSTAHMTESQLNERLKTFESHKQIYLAAAFVTLLLIPVGFFALGLSWWVQTGLTGTTLYFLLLAMQADYRAWILEQKRFGGLYDYLTNRFPRNMQVILPRRDK